MKFLFGLCSALALMLLIASPAQAQLTRTWVATTGNDANTCLRSAPCLTFQGAFGKTAVNGDINCLDAGDFNPVTITKSITIDCHDVFDSIQHAQFSSGILILFDSFTDTRRTVILRNLGLTGGDQGTNSIQINSTNATGTTVVVDDCLIQGNFLNVGRGIDDRRAAGGKLIVTHTTIRNNTGAGISVLPASGSSNIQVLLNNVSSYHNGTGAQFGNLTRVMIDQSIFDGNTGAGVLTVAGAIVSIKNSTITHNANGVQAAGGTVALANSDIQLNTSQGINNSGGTVFSFGNNRIAFNASPGTAPSPAGAASSDLGQQ